MSYKHDFTTSKHSQLRSWFNKKFIYEDKIFDDEMLKIYNNTFEYRQKSDYTVTYIPDLETVENLLLDAEKFVKNVEKIIYL